MLTVLATAPASCSLLDWCAVAVVSNARCGHSKGLGRHLTAMKNKLGYRGQKSRDVSSHFLSTRKQGAFFLEHFPESESISVALLAAALG